MVPKKRPQILEIKNGRKYASYGFNKKNLVSPTPQNKTNKINLSLIFNSSYENPNINWKNITWYGELLIIIDVRTKVKFRSN